MTSQGGRAVQAILLRHGQVAHHRSDVGLTDLGVAQSEAAGRWFAEQGVEIECLLSGETARTLDTATAFAAGYRGVDGSPELPEPAVSFALRNPDLYLGGHRVNIAEGAEAIAGQAPGISPEDVVRSPFFGELISAEEAGRLLVGASESARRGRPRRCSANHVIRPKPRRRGRTSGGNHRGHHPLASAQGRPAWIRERLYAGASVPPRLLAHPRGRTGDISFSTFETHTGDIPATSKPGSGFKEA